MKRLFEGLAGFVTGNWKKVLLGFAGVFLITGFLSKLLFDNLNVSWIDMVPKQTRVVREYRKILKDFSSATGMIVTVQGPDRKTVEKAIAGAGSLLKNRNDLFRNVYYRTDKKFMGRYGLLLQKAKDLRRNTPYLTGLNLVDFIRGINSSLESEYVGNADNMKQNENDVATFLTGLEDLGRMIGNAATGEISTELIKRNAGFFTTGPDFMVSPDGKTGLITLIPAAPVDNIPGCVRTADELDTMLAGLQRQYPGVVFGQTGMHTLSRDEMKTSGDDSMMVTAIAFILIIVFLIAAFRMKSAPVLGMLTLVIGITICLGIAYVVIGSLNMMTVMVGAILMGLGIDYSVHILSQFTEAIASGADAAAAVHRSLQDCGRGLVTGALTTAAAFGIFVLIPYEGLAELGLITGIGVLSCMITSVLLLPVLLMLRQRLKERREIRRPAKKAKNRIPMQYTFLAQMEEKINRWPLVTVAAALIFTVAMAVQLPSAVFSGDLKEIEMKGLKSLQLNDMIKDKFDMTSDSVFIVTDSLEADRKYRKILQDNPQISMVDSPSLYLPSKEEQKNRLKEIRRIGRALAVFRIKTGVDRKALAKEILRLKANVLEMRDLAYTSGLDRVFKRSSRVLGGTNRSSRGVLDRAADFVKSSMGNLVPLQRMFAAALKKNLQPMTGVQGIGRRDLTPEIKSRVFSKDGKKGLLTAWLMKDNWADLHKSPFLDNLIRTSGGKVTGMILFMRELVNTASREGSRATLLALGMILLIVLIDFKSFKVGGFAFLNLVAVVVSMTGLIILLGVKFNFVNVLALPILIGIGIDDSVHILHRYRSGDNLRTVLSSTGRGILLTSLTTMVGFGSLAFASFQGLQSFGIVLFFGVGIAFLYSVILLPALIRLFPGRGHLSNNRGA